MRLIKFTIQFLLFTLIFLSVAACSSSSSSQRYDRNDDRDDGVTEESVRFTSDDDETSYNNRPPEREFDEEPYEEYPVDKESFVKNYKHLGQLSSTLTEREKILFEIVKFLDTPYQYGGESTKGIDCSAFTQQVYNNSVKLKLPRTASQQYNVGDSINKSELKFGDLVFFNTSSSSYPGHVGIFVGENLFAHASISKGVTISSLKNSYYQDRFIGGKRID